MYLMLKHILKLNMTVNLRDDVFDKTCLYQYDEIVIN